MSGSCRYLSNTLFCGSWVVAIINDPAKRLLESGACGMPKLTKTVIESLVAIDGKPIILWDTVSGFGVKALPSGKKTFVVKYRVNGGGRGAQQRWLTLGQFGHITWVGVDKPVIARCRSIFLNALAHCLNCPDCWTIRTVCSADEIEVSRCKFMEQTFVGYKRGANNYMRLGTNS